MSSSLSNQQNNMNSNPASPMLRPISGSSSPYVRSVHKLHPGDQVNPGFILELSGLGLEGLELDGLRSFGDKYPESFVLELPASSVPGQGAFNYSQDSQDPRNPRYTEYEQEYENDQLADYPQYGYDPEYNAQENTDADDMDNVIDVFALIEQKRKVIVPKVSITSLSVSTQSAKAKMNQVLDLRSMFDTIRDAIQENIIDGKRKDFSIVGAEHKNESIGAVKVRTSSKKQFPNNVTVLVRSPMRTGKVVNIKIFRQGSISMTGCKVKEDGIAATKILEKFLAKHPALFGTGSEAKTKAKAFRITDFEVTMINSNYSLGFTIDRERLYNILCEHYPDFSVSYEPAIYSGVKIGFYYNDTKPDGKQDGVCVCPRVCKGKGTGHGIGNCKRVTVSVFQSGNVINTGGRSMKQTVAAYEYVNEIIRKYANEIVLISILDLEKLEKGQE